jgi:inorganic pyrophosphatase
MKPLADSTRLKPLNKRDGPLQVIIETSARSRNEFALDHPFPFSEVAFA